MVSLQASYYVYRHGVGGFSATSGHMAHRLKGAECLSNAVCLAGYFLVLFIPATWQTSYSSIHLVVNLAC